MKIPGEGSSGKADLLAARMRDEVEGWGVRIARPAKHAELRVRGLVDSVTPEQVVAALAVVSECPEGEIAIGTVRSSPFGLGSAWVRVPLSAIRKVAEARRILERWMSCPVDTLGRCPLQCYRCLGWGHTQQR